MPARRRDSLEAMTAFATVGVGVPYRFVGDGWDPAPLVLAIAMVALLRLARFRLRPPALAGVVLAALIVDHMTDAYDVSVATAIAILTLVFGMLALARISAS
jgi:hypothetical protein